MTLLQELVAFGRRGHGEVSVNQDTHELIFLYDAWDRDGYAYHLWEEDGLWCFGRTSRFRNFKKPFASLSAPDFDIAARWLIHEVGGSVRPELRMHPLAIPVEGAIHAEDIAPGWSYWLGEDLIGHLITPRGIALNMKMKTTTQRATELIKFSHLMGFTPQQLLTSYQDPYGRPYLTRYLHENPAFVRMGNPLPTPIPPLETT